MVTRRLSAFAVAALVTLLVAIPAVAQDDGSTVTVTLTTRTVAGSADSATIAATANESGVGRDCSDGWPEDGNSTLNGEPPSESTSSVLTSINVPGGPAWFDAYTGQLFGGDIDVTSDVTLAATYYLFERIGDSEATVAPTVDATEEAAADVEADDAATLEETDSDFADVSLPNTGSGQGDATLASTIVLLLLGFVCASGAIAIRLCSGD